MIKKITLLTLLALPFFATSQNIDTKKIINSLSNVNTFKEVLINSITIDTIFNDIPLKEGGILYKAYIPKDKGITMIVVSEYRIGILFTRPGFDYFIDDFLTYLMDKCLYNTSNTNTDFIEWKCDDVLIDTSTENENGYLYFTFLNE